MFSLQEKIKHAGLKVPQQLMLYLSHSGFLNTSSSSYILVIIPISHFVSFYHGVSKWVTNLRHIKIIPRISIMKNIKASGGILKLLSY